MGRIVSIERLRIVLTSDACERARFLGQIPNCYTACVNGALSTRRILIASAKSLSKALESWLRCRPVLPV